MPGSSSGFYLPTEIYTDGEHIFMSAGSAFDKELWISDGTTVGTYEFEINPDGESTPGNFYKYGEKLFLFAYEEEFGTEPYILDLTMTSTDDLSNNKLITIYPNPTNGIFHITNLEIFEGSHLIYNINGEFIIKRVNSKSIDLSQLPVGVYILKSMDVCSRVINFEKIILLK